jgi:hypothetical protein
MADLTFGEVGKIVQLDLINIDPTVSPPAQTPLDLTNATLVHFLYRITNANNKPSSPIFTKQMTVIFPTLGIAQYQWKTGDLVNNPNVGKYGVLRYAVRVTYNDGTILYSNLDGQFTIKDDSIF